MHLLATAVVLHDIDDVEMFIQAQLNTWRTRAGIYLSVDDREELTAEALCIMFELAGRFEPHRPGYEKAGRFSGFAAAYLPKKLGDAWHRRDESHRYVTDPDTGKRRWRFYQQAASLDAIRDRIDGSAGGHVADEPFLGPDDWVPVAALPERVAA